MSSEAEGKRKKKCFYKYEMLPEPSPVSIAAVDDLQVLVIYSDAVNTMIERQPSLGRDIGQIIEARSKAVSMAGQADVSSRAEVDSL